MDTWDAGGSELGSRVTLDCSRPPVVSIFASEICSDFKKKLFSLYISRNAVNSVELQKKLCLHFSES